jgi:CHAD domain-containing protein
MKLRTTKTAGENASVLLPKLLEKYFKAGRKAADSKQSPRKLHGFRLATKRFRYSLELFRPCYGPSLDRKLAALGELQSALGKLSDYESVRATLAGDKALEAKLERASKRKLKEFREKWAAFDADGQQKRWRQYLEKSK